MKYSEKMQLIFKGYSKDEIKALEEQEAKEAAEAAKKAEDEAAKKAEDDAAKKAEDDAAKKAEESSEVKTALELAQSMIKDLETKLEAKDDELAKLNQQFATLNNKQTVADEPKQEDASDVMAQLFNNKKED